jgi:hypothetical protein
MNDINSSNDFEDLIDASLNLNTERTDRKTEKGTPRQ